MVDSELRVVLERAYGFSVERLTPMFGHGDRALHLAVTTDDSKLVARVYGSARPFERVEGDAAVMSHARAARISAEEPVPTIGGRLAAGFGCRSVVVSRYVAGPTAPHASDDLRQLGFAAGQLSRLTVAAGDRLIDRRAGSLPREDLAAARSELRRVGDAVPPRWRATYDAIVEAVADTQDGEDLPRAVIHPDLQPGNAIRGPGGRVVLIDWEGAGLGPRLLPLAILLSRATIRRDSEGSWETDLEPVGPIVQGFRRLGSATAPELARLADLIRVRPLAIAARELAAGLHGGEPDPASGWWSRYQEAGRVAEVARSQLSG